MTQETKPKEYTGKAVSYYTVAITNPMRGKDTFTVECGEVIEALGMDFNEGNAFKALWRRCAARTLGLFKKGYTDGLYDAEKVVYFGERMVAMEKQRQVVTQQNTEQVLQGIVDGFQKDQQKQLKYAAEPYSRPFK